jgi:hypothetical protein
LSDTNPHLPLRQSIDAFAQWLAAHGYASYDPYDIWGTGYGLNARRLYYRGHPLGVLLIAPILLMEMLCPVLRGLFVAKARCATADAQLILAFLNLYSITGEQEWLRKATELSREMLSYHVPGYRDYC